MIESSSLKQSLLHANESSSKAPATAAAVVDSSCKRSLTAASAAAGNDEGLYCSETTILSYANIEKQLRRRTIIVGYVIFLNEACKGILFPILWSLCYHLGGNRFDQGLLVATFACGRVLLTTHMGIIADQYRHRAALLISCCILIVGAFTWSISYSTRSLAVLFMGQFLLGAGTATNGVCRSYVSERVPVQKRTNALSRLKAIQFAGFSLTVLLGCLIVVLGQSFSVALKFSLPPLFLTAYAFSSMILLYFFFVDIPPSKELHDQESSDERGYQHGVSNTSGTIPTAMAKRSDEDADDAATLERETASTYHSGTKLSIEADNIGTDEDSPQIPADYLRQSYTYLMLPETQLFAILVGNNIGAQACVVAYETLMSRILLDDYHLSFISLGLVVSSAGAVGVLMLVFFRELWTNRFRDSALVIGGFFALCTAQLFVLDWTATTRVSLGQFCFSVYLVFALGYPIGAGANLGLFSTALGYGRQGKAQSLFVLSGAATEIIFPILSGVLEQYVKSNLTFSVVLFVVACRIMSVLAWYVLVLTYTNRSANNAHGTPNSQPAVFDDANVRLVVGLIVGVLAVIGMYSFITVTVTAVS